MVKQLEQIPLVSVKMITYGHEAYIRQAIEGVLMQETDFEYDLIVADDCSPDNTNGIVNDIISSHPLGYRIKYFRHDKNLGMLGNGLFGFSKCTGKYIAFCEGDDYWTDPLKLHKQVDFLESHLPYSFCFHNDMVLNQSTGDVKPRFQSEQMHDILDVRSIIIKNICPTASLMFRTHCLKNKIPEWFSKTSKGDYGLVVLLSEQGYGKYITDVMSVYRVHSDGVWSRKNDDYHFKENIKFYNYLLEYFSSFEIKSVIRAKLSKELFNHGVNLLRMGNFTKGLAVIIKNVNFNKEKELQTKIGKIPRAVLQGIKSKIFVVNY